MYSKLQDGNFIVSGFVARDSELKCVGEKSSSLCRWSVKVGEKINGNEKTPIWLNCQAWHGVAVNASEIKKGDTVLCVGRLETYTGNDGKIYKNLVCEFVSVMKSIPKSLIVSKPETSEITDLADFETILSDDSAPF